MSRFIICLAVAVSLCYLLAASSGSEPHNSSKEDKVYMEECHCEEVDHHCQSTLGANDTFPVAKLQWEEVNIPVTIGLWVILSSLVRIGFSFTPFEKYIPESCILMCIGFIIGLIIYVIDVSGSSDIRLDTELFFLYLLPPIMLEAGYFMPVRAFNDNLATILLFAVIGTLFNAVTVGLSLYAVSEFGWLGFNSTLNETIHINFLECFTFSSLISAVDPVAVLAVFEEIHVNQVLYILVFGESLLNDAVTVVLYRMFETFNQIGQENLDGVDIVAGVMSFFVVSIGGIFVGILFGFLTALISRFAHHIRVIEPVFVFVMSYLAYLIAEMLSLSSILAIVACAMVMKPYVERNISQKSHTTIKYSMKMMSSLSETIIFIFLGISAITENERHQWNTSFVMFTLLFTFIYRFIGVIWQCFLVNRYRLIRINSKEKFIMAYGGIRGAIAFSLAALLCEGTVAGNKIFFTTTFMVVMFTMFIQGMTIKPLVNKLHVKKEEKQKPSMNEEIFFRVNDHILAGMELILGQGAHNLLREKWRHFDDRYVKKLLIRDHRPIRDPKILDVYQKLTEKDATDYIKEHGTFHLSASVSNFLRNEIGSSGMIYSHSNASMAGDVSYITASPTKTDEKGLLVCGEIPMGEGVTCLDMHATDVQAVPERVKKESQFGHSDILTKNMYRPRSQIYPKSKMSVSPTESSLMYRSMKIQIDHKLKKRKRHHHHRKSKTSLPAAKESDTNLLSPPTLVFHKPQDNKPQTNNSLPPISPDDDEGITFSATRSPSDDDEPDMGHKMSIQESSVPWKLDQMNVMTSERASEDPHDEFGNQVPLSPYTPERGNDEGDEQGTKEGPDNVKIVINIGSDEDEEGVNQDVSLLGVEDSDQRQTSA